MEICELYVVSDYIVETGESLARAITNQFDMTNFSLKRFPYITEKDQIDDLIEKIDKPQQSMILVTIFLPRIKNYLMKKAREREITVIDVYGTLLDTFEDKLGQKSKNILIASKKMDKSYFSRIEAVEFAVKYDDGKDYRGILDADVVLIGISRTSKTPLSMYLAHKALKVANVPLVPEASLPKELFEIDPRHIVGLTANPVKLNEIRIERLKALGLDENAAYANLDRIYEEIDHANGVFEKLGCKVINVSNNAIEETAEVILNHHRKISVV
ncbi:MAG: kinase/pyrophosphorylase [Tissierellales bacterium]|jgi:regulator of PEP synthase PpsR (kinase-PPPase family)|nr:kinase/pyrophosphorylase [Tissierellales bacterium]